MAGSRGFDLYRIYLYVRSNPLSFADPRGLLLEQIFSGNLDAHSSRAVTADTFVNYATGKNIQEIQHAASRNGVWDSSAGGPDSYVRYVRDPANLAAIIDMRHFVVIGQKGEIFGLAVEIVQALGGDRRSAFDPQDFYSNALGVQFFNSYDPRKDFASQLRDFFNKRRNYCDR